MKLTRILVAAAVVTALTAGTAAAQSTLENVKSRGQLKCGVSTGLAGFSQPNAQGKWEGFDVDYCRAVAAAIFGDPDKVAFTPTTAKERFTALQSGEIDILSRNTTWTLSRDVQLGFEFVGTDYYDGQGFMIRKDMGISSAKQLDGASVCIQTGTTTELNLADFFRSHNMKFEPVTIDTSDQAREAYEAGRCDVYTTDASGLAAQRASMADPSAHVILPEIISKEPLGPLVRHGDNNWGDIGRWVLNAMITAEEDGVTSKNVDEMKTSSDNPEVKRLLGVEGEMGAMLGLPNEWAYNIIKSVGNYSEVFERNVGVKTPLGLERGLNALWKDGGILYSPPFR
ncbi:L-glutamine-binding protein /L-glutamate-binding protein /L-aspartate-binding protein /L-asparagine-binding protein [Tistlia consotensis]|uniref:L-glutamine-binding protein /L-glutamate-binding protein /L-aspartate-binding protein /L-asparagine-binding protein n=1 Tax=Tistlia consotensis USBA 355 TaxID=560819 RepID=A0A1Y6BDZ0_9PROT|nr:amino acid ABC transporter substrate-binding protein [Tistlia consotensis]SMF05156.1 L-glutamine-binding protein /L-glutamate-binding protein /L-aspartate-binding protein /L-asparagine-binding protein [Tistlia consotensis USBA 355]SNR55057.1 L-glutamine-binding protein /L-glutamate-binding protein /L-aspartate-binding protein /L-asparagine-binding protein [Tistlia consotensis]